MTNFFLDKYDLKCLTPEVEVKQSETVEIRYKLLEYKKGNWEPCPDKTITFIATNGRCTPEWTKTNAEGIATVSFSPTSTDVTEGMVEGKFKIILDPKTGFERIFDALALVTITESYKLECLTKEVEIKKGETADIRFRLMEFEEGKWVTCSGVVNFTAENGTSNPEWMQADDDGLTHATFIPAADATEGTLTGSISIEINDNIKLTWADVAHITIIDGGGGGGEGPGGGGDIKDEGLKKADKLDDNTYVVDEKKVTIGGNEEDYVYYYYKTDPESDKSVVCIEFCKEHPVYYTVGGGSVHVTPDMIDKEIDMLKEQPDGMAWMNLFTLKDINQGHNSETNPATSVSAGSTEGNAELEKAVCKVSKDKDGGYTALMYFKTKDGMEAYAKMKAKVVAPWATN